VIFNELAGRVVVMRHLAGLVLGLALSATPLVGCSGSGDAGVSGGSGGVGGVGGGTGGFGGDETPIFSAGDPVTVSSASPFADCTADEDPGAMLAADSEVEPWVAVNPREADHIAVAWQQDRYTAGGGARGHVVGVTFDGGESWGSVVVPGLSPCSGGDWHRTTDPWLAFGADGQLYAAALSFRDSSFGGAVVVSRSEDGGLTWDAPVIVDEIGDPEFNDRETLTADPVDACTLYVTWTRFDGNPSEVTAGDVLFSRTDDCGATWSDPVTVHSSDPVGIAAQIVVLPDRSLVAFFKENLRGLVERPLWVKRSIDGGATWPGEPIVAAATRQAVPVTPDGSPVRSSSYDVAVDRDTGDLYVIWEHLFTDLSTPIQVALSASTDGGNTWSAPIRVDKTPDGSVFSLEQAFLPSIEVTDDGTVGITYYNFENDTPTMAPSETDYWFIHCNSDFADCTDADGWSEGLRLTPSSFDYLSAPSITTGTRGLFLGDYMGLASGGADFFAFFSATTEEDPANGIFVPIRAE
jgi:hypothetical protein